MIQLKVCTMLIACACGTNVFYLDITQLYRQLGRVSRRVRQRPQEETARNYWSVPRTSWTGMRRWEVIQLILET